MRGRRPGQRGLLRGCCAGLLLLLVLIGLAAFAANRATAAPALGPPPQGPDHGDTEQAVGAAIAEEIVTGLIAAPHARATLSESDLTVFARAENPHPDRFRNVLARIRDGLVVVSADTSAGPLGVTAVAHLSVTLDEANGVPGDLPTLQVRVVELDIGAITLPGFLRDRLVGTAAPSLGLDQLFNGSPALQALRGSVECVTVTAQGLRLGVHRPGVPPDPTACGGS